MQVAPALAVVRPLRVLADESLVNLDNAAARAERGEVAGAHRLADAVLHEPRGLVGHAQRAVELVGTDTLLAGGHEDDRLYPKVQGDLAVLEDRADLDGELALAVAAAPQT